MTDRDRPTPQLGINPAAAAALGIALTRTLDSGAVPPAAAGTVATCLAVAVLLLAAAGQDRPPH